MPFFYFKIRHSTFNLVGNATVTFAINVSDSLLSSIALTVFTFGVTTCCGADNYVDPANELCE